MSKSMKNKHISEPTFADIVNTCAIACGARSHNSGFTTVAWRLLDEPLAQPSTSARFMHVCVRFQSAYILGAP